MRCRPQCLGTLGSRKHLGRALVRFKIALSLGASSKNLRSMLIFDQKIGDFAFKVILLERFVPEKVSHLIYEKLCSRARHPQNLRFTCQEMLKNCAPVETIRLS